MKRLRDEGSEDSVVSGEGIDLLRGTPSTSAMPDMKRRVWAAVGKDFSRPIAVRHPLRLRMVMTAALVLCVVGTAGAVIARRFIAPLLHPAPAPAAPATTVSVPVRTPPVARRAAPEPAIAEGEAPSPVEPSRPESVPVTPRVAGGRGTSARGAVPLAERSSVRAADTSVAASTPRERAEVLDAMVALRRDHDAGRAGKLLDRYLTGHPRGALREEALALAIEAADARGDRATVTALARTYQSAYPGGRFASFAQSNLKNAAP
jgi:hypothetical protein